MCKTILYSFLYFRVHPDKSLKAIREELGSLLLRSEVMDRYYFLKCVGRSLAMVGSLCRNNTYITTV